MLKFKRSSLYTLIAFVCMFAAGGYYTYLNIAAERNEQRLLMEEVMSAQSSNIERNLSQSLSTTYILAQEVRRSHGQFKDFDYFAEEVIQTLGGVSSLQLAPDGITKIVYPLTGNEVGIGHNLLQSDERRNEAWEAIRSKTLTLAGPFMLRQGRVGMIGRNPVFLESNGEPYFWGFTMALIYLDDLLKSTEIEQLQQKGYAYQLSRTHPDTGQKHIFARSSNDLDKLQIQKRVRVPNGEWTLTLSRPTNTGWQVCVGILISLLTAGIFTLLIHRVLLEPERLRELVKKQTILLQQLAFNDELTGLANRRAVTEQLDKAILQLQRDDKCLALMYIDLDDFKRINDTTGHQDGDQLLVEVAQRLKNTVRETDIVGRLGGDEFAVVLTNVKSTEHVRILANKIITQLSQPVQLAHSEAIVGASIGIALAPQDGNCSNELLCHADLAMYQSKRIGKNQFSFYDATMKKQRLSPTQIENT